MSDFIKRCTIHTYRSLFPNNIKNKGIVYFINIIHIIGVIFIQLGLFMKPVYIKIYIIYLVFLFVTYILLNNKCFMTIVSNYFSEANYNMLCIKMQQAKTVLGIYLILAIVFYMNPQIAPYTIIKSLISK
jgi:hypothetical protein